MVRSKKPDTMKKILTTLALFTFYHLSQAQTFSWVTPFSYDDYNIASSIKVDATGNSYVCGNYYITGSAGPPTGTSGAFIAKFSSAGSMLWTDTVKDSDAGGCRLDIDASGNVYFATYVTGTHMIGGTSVTSMGLKDIVIAKYNTSGALQWVKSAGGSGNDAAQGIAADAAGNIFVTGYFGTTASFDGTMKTAVGYSDIFLAKYSAAGTLMWVQTASGDADTTSGTGIDQAMDLALDNTGNPVIAGYFAREVMFGGTTLTSPGVGGGFIAKADALGNWVWATNTGTAPTGIDMDNTGNGYISGAFAGSATIGSTTLTSGGSLDVYLAKFDNSGAILWVKQAGGTDEDRGYDVAVDNLGNPYLTGSFMGDMAFGSTNLTISGEENSFVAKYDASGNFVWAKQISANPGAWEFVTSHAIDMDASNNAYIAGTFFAAAIFDSFSFTSGNPSDAFVAKLNTAVAAGINDLPASSFTAFCEGGHVIGLSYDSTISGIVQLQLVNIMGQCIYEEKNLLLTGSGHKQIAIPAAAKGVYFLNIISKDQQMTTKLFID
jgi:hypothetical protein